MAALLIGYARCSTDQQDLTAQRDGLLGLGVAIARIYVDHGLTGTNRDRPGLREALAACREGDTLVVTKLDRLARSLPDARAIADELTARQVRLSLGGSVYDPNDAVGRLLFNVLAMVAEFESDLIRLRTREGMKVAKAKAGCVESSPSSTPAKKLTWSASSRLESTALPNSPTCSGLAAPPSTGPASEAERRKPDDDEEPSRSPHPEGRPPATRKRPRGPYRLRFRFRGCLGDHVRLCQSWRIVPWWCTWRQPSSSRRHRDVRRARRPLCAESQCTRIKPSASMRPASPVTSISSSSSSVWESSSSRVLGRSHIRPEAPTSLKSGAKSSRTLARLFRQTLVCNSCSS